MSARRGEVVRFYLTNTANTRVFNFAISDARMKLVGGDSGRCEHEEFVDDVVSRLRAGRRGRALRDARAGGAGAPDAGADLRASAPWT